MRQTIDLITKWTGGNYVWNDTSGKCPPGLRWDTFVLLTKFLITVYHNCDGISEEFKKMGYDIWLSTHNSKKGDKFKFSDRNLFAKVIYSNLLCILFRPSGNNVGSLSLYDLQKTQQRLFYNNRANLGSQDLLLLSSDLINTNSFEVKPSKIS